MDTTIVYIDQSEVRPGKIDAVKAAITALVALVGPKEPQLVAYSIYLDEAERRMSVVAVHPDAASMELHMDVGAPGFARFEGLIDLRSIDVYGIPSDRVRRQLSDKARLLGGAARVTIHEPRAGLDRAGHRSRTSDVLSR